ncbi:MAG: hypothetical protein WC757_01145 [Candidatus Paceibacterota bacterium]
MNTMDTLQKLFGSAAKVKIMRLFLFNQKMVFDLDDVMARSKTGKAETRKEIALLESIGMLIKRDVHKSVEVKKGKKKVFVSKKFHGWKLNDKCQYLLPLQTFLISMMPVTKGDLAERFMKAGKIKMVVTSGVFNQYWDARVDLLIVGDNIKKTALDNAVKGLESEVGKELVYSVFETDDFLYRLGVCDKLVRDILDYPHEKVFNKLNII